MAAGGGEVAVGIKVQSALGTSAGATGATTYSDIKLDEFTEDVGYITDEGRPEIGGSLYTVGSSEKYGAAPFYSMTGKVRLEELKDLLPVVGWAETGSGPWVYTPVTASADFDYFTMDVKYSDESGNQYQIIDSRGARLIMTYNPRTAPVFSLDAVGGNHQESVALHEPYAAQTVPSPATAILGANTKWFGVNSFKVYGFSFSIENGIDNTRQPLGQLTPDDVVPTVLSSRADGLLQMSNATYRRLKYGGAALTAASAAKDTGALSMRILNGTKYVQYDFSAAEYFLGDPIPVTPTSQVLVPVRARCTGTATVTVSLT